MPAETIKEGSRIRFKHDLECGPTEDHPAFIYARRGELGTITRVGNCREGFWATWDRCPNSFGVSREEFELVQ